MLIEIFCDGAARGIGAGEQRSSVGEGACAVVIHKNNKLLGQYVRGLGKVSNNRAEAEAVLLALMIAWAADLRDPILYSDSEVVCKQVNGDWRCKSNDMKPLLLSIWEIGDVFRFRLQKVPRAHVKSADSLNNLFLDKLQSVLDTDLQKF